MRHVLRALSFDDGESWPVRRLVSDGGPNRIIEALDGAPCTLGPRNAEVNGYLSAWQSADGRIQLISSTNHYSFNLPWLVERQSGSSIGTARRARPSQTDQVLLQRVEAPFAQRA